MYLCCQVNNFMILKIYKILKGIIIILTNYDIIGKFIRLLAIEIIHAINNVKFT